MNFKKGLVSFIVIAFCCTFTFAQNKMSSLEEEPQWYQVEFMRFNSGKAETAIKIIEDYFVKANQVAGMPVPVIELDIDFENFHYLVLWKLNENGDTLNWQTSPANENWYRAFVGIAGREDLALEIIKEFDACIADHKTELARKQ